MRFPMDMSAPRSSVFTFESTVHSSHVLRSLDEQRRRDVLCDVTVVVEGQSYRAHRAVLSSCSEYFTQRITQHGAVITLPLEVTVAGFEPLLKFAYTSKLLFGKDNVVEIRNSASVLGFRDLDEACFDFLLPKFLSSSKSSAPFPRNTCCKKNCKGYLSKEELGIESDDAMLNEKGENPVADSSFEQDVVWLCNKSVNSKIGSQNSSDSLTPVAEGKNDHFMQCPKYRRQLACGKEICVTDKGVNNPVTVIKDNYDLSCSTFSSSACIKNETELELPNDLTSNQIGHNNGETDHQWKTEKLGKKTEDDISGGKGHRVKNEPTEMQGQWSENERGMGPEEDISNTFTVMAVPSGLSTALGEGSSGLILHHPPLMTLGEGPAICGSVGHERFDIDMDTTEDKTTRASGVKMQVTIHQRAEEHVDAECNRADEATGWLKREKGGKNSSMEEEEQTNNHFRDRGIVEWEVAKQLGSDVDWSQLSSQDRDAGCTPGAGRARTRNPSLEWMNFHTNFRSTSSGCPFFQLDQGKCLWKSTELSECEGASQSGVSSINSGEDGESETETEGDSELYARERARQVQLPFSIDWIVDLSRNDFQQLLKEHVFTREQLAFVHDMRRRSKNRLAAQRCRKRKLDCIYNLQCEINKLKAEREKLITEKNQLGQLKVKTCDSVSALCQRVCSEANLQPEQLQVLSKYTSPDCPLSSFFPHIDALLSQFQAPLPAGFLGLDEYKASEEEAPSISSRDTVTGNSQDLL
ncbi:transcription regulator protein BACH1b [Antennarius striatus]|uniref:transcription regulator protein BACH1b n=1 Tax=Antennarius striatus TaxID=241820 RepID=UPI0035B2AE94